MKNHRHYNRYAMTCKGQVINSNSHKFRFHLNNISASGMNITTDLELKESKILTIKFESTGIHMPFTKHLKGLIVRSYSDYKYGIRFLEQTPDDIIELDEYLRFIRSNTNLH